MFCTKCGNQINDGQRFCTNCGSPVKGTERSFDSEIKQKAKKVKKPWTLGRIVKYIVVATLLAGLLFIKLIFSAIGLVDQDAVSSNDRGINALESGDYDSAIQHLEEASDSAVTSSTKLNTLLNLGYAYSSDGKSTEALKNFKEALTHATPDSFEYHLISGEIALLENNPQKAFQNYTTAYNKKPNDFQINNALNLFYLDLDGAYPEYADESKALTYAKKAYEVSSSDTKSTAAENLGIAYFINGEYRTAITYFQQTNQNQPYIQLWLGMSYYSLEEYRTAKPYLQRAQTGGVTEANKFLESY